MHSYVQATAGNENDNVSDHDSAHDMNLNQMSLVINGDYLENTWDLEKIYEVKKLSNWDIC